MNRYLLESYVIAWNKHLKPEVHEMNAIILLRNAHPAYRDVFARLMLDEGNITKDEASEFLKIIGR